MNLVKDALYILSKDITNPKPDRRERHDWRKRITLSAGLKFRARLISRSYDKEVTATLAQIPGFGVDLKWFQLEPAFPGTWSHQTVAQHDPLFDVLVEALVLASAGLTDVLREAREKKFVSPEDIIERLVNTDRLRIEDLNVVIDECHEALGSEP